MNTESLIKRTFIQASIAMAVVLFAWMLATNSKIILTGFGGILIAVLFSGSASWLGNKTNLPRKAWLPVTVIVPFILLLLFLSYTGPKIATQASELAERMPKELSKPSDSKCVRSLFSQFTAASRVPYIDIISFPHRCSSPGSRSSSGSLT